MHEIKIGDVVRSFKGRDSGDYFYVIELDDNFVKIVDGKQRRLEAPKTKNIKHVRFVPTDDTRVKAKIVSGEKITNSEVRKTLASFYYEVDDEI